VAISLRIQKGAAEASAQPAIKPQDGSGLKGRNAGCIRKNQRDASSVAGFSSRAEAVARSDAPTRGKVVLKAVTDLVFRNAGRLTGTLRYNYPIVRYMVIPPNFFVAVFVHSSRRLPLPVAVAVTFVRVPGRSPHPATARLYLYCLRIHLRRGSPHPHHLHSYSTKWVLPLTQQCAPKSWHA
jgi:hypothetical protein